MDIHLSFPALRKCCVLIERLLYLGSSSLSNCFSFQIPDQLNIFLCCKLQAHHTRSGDTVGGVGFLLFGVLLVYR